MAISFESSRNLETWPDVQPACKPEGVIYTYIEEDK